MARPATLSTATAATPARPPRRWLLQPHSLPAGARYSRYTCTASPPLAATATSCAFSWAGAGRSQLLPLPPTSPASSPPCMGRPDDDGGGVAGGAAEAAACCCLAPPAGVEEGGGISINHTITYRKNCSDALITFIALCGD